MEYILLLLRRVLWPKTPPRGRFGRLLILARYPYALLRDLATGELNLRAMSLVYTTILAFVPTTFFVFAIAQVIGVHRELQPVIFGFLEPLGPRAEDITNNVINFFDNISGGVLAAFSIGLLLLTVMSMAQKIEASFNYVWRVDRPRNLARRFGEYLSVIVVGLMALFIASALVASLSSNFLVERMRESQSVAAWIGYLGDVVPFLIVVATFSALYWFVPNTQVKPKPALLGGVTAGVLWTAGGLLFRRLVVASTEFDAIYSGFATVILLMLWLYFSWLILLLGLQLAFYVQNPFHLPYGHRGAAFDNSARERMSLAIMLLIARDFADPKQGWTSDSLAATLLVPRHALEPIVAALSERGMIIKVNGDRLLPGKDIRGIRLRDIVAAVRGNKPADAVPADPINLTVNAIAARVDAAIQQELGEQTLADLVDSSAT